MDKFENEEKFGFYYESDQDSHLSDSDWVPSQEEISEYETSQEMSEDEILEEEV